MRKIETLGCLLVHLSVTARTEKIKSSQKNVLRTGTGCQFITLHQDIKIRIELLQLLLGNTDISYKKKRRLCLKYDRIYLNLQYWLEKFTENTKLKTVFGCEKCLNNWESPSLFELYLKIPIKSWKKRDKFQKDNLINCSWKIMHWIVGGYTILSLFTTYFSCCKRAWLWLAFRLNYVDLLKYGCYGE